MEDAIIKIFIGVITVLLGGSIVALVRMWGAQGRQETMLTRAVQDISEVCEEVKTLMESNRDIQGDIGSVVSKLDILLNRSSGK